MGREIPETSASWKASMPRSFTFACPVITTIGTESICAVRMPVIVLVAPGPDVTSTTAGWPHARAYPSAICVAPCSCRVSTRWMEESTRASNRGIAAPPGRPNTYFTPCFSSMCTTAWAPVHLCPIVFSSMALSCL